MTFLFFQPKYGADFQPVCMFFCGIPGMFACESMRFFFCCTLNLAVPERVVSLTRACQKHDINIAQTPFINDFFGALCWPTFFSDKNCLFYLEGEGSKKNK